MRLIDLRAGLIAPLLCVLSVITPAPATAQDLNGEGVLRIQVHRVEESRRPAALMPMYGSLIALQGLDIHSTRRGMSSGKTREANPIMEPVVNNGAAFIAVKAGVTAGAIWVSERLWKRNNRKAAIFFSTAINVIMASVVTHNYRLANK